MITTNRREAIEQMINVFAIERGLDPLNDRARIVRDFLRTARDGSITRTRLAKRVYGRNPAQLVSDAEFVASLATDAPASQALRVASARSKRGPLPDGAIFSYSPKRGRETSEQKHQRQVDASGASAPSGLVQSIVPDEPLNQPTALVKERIAQAAAEREVQQAKAEQMVLMEAAQPGDTETASVASPGQAEVAQAALGGISGRGALKRHGLKVLLFIIGAGLLREAMTD